MRSPDRVADENKRMRRLRVIVDLTAGVLAQERLTVDEALDLINATRRTVLRLFPGKEETFRCRWGTVYLYVPGAASSPAHCTPPAGREKHYTVRHEIVLTPGKQYTLGPDALHWFQAGEEGAVVSEFSTRSRDEMDVFTDPDIGRITKIVD